MAGASGFLFKGCPAREIRETILAVLSGEAPPTNDWWKRVLAELRARVRAASGSAPPASGLTPQEAEVMRHLALGMDNKAIARAMGLSYPTVRSHCSSAFRKLGVSDRLQAVLKGIREGWLRAEEE